MLNINDMRWEERAIKTQSLCEVTCDKIRVESILNDLRREECCINTYEVMTVVPCGIQQAILPSTTSLLEAPASGVEILDFNQQSAQAQHIDVTTYVVSIEDDAIHEPTFQGFSFEFTNENLQW